MEKPWGRMVGIRPAKQLHRLLDAGHDYNSAFMRMQADYLLGEEKFDLLWRVAQVERPVLAESSAPGLFSVYVGIPFCPTRCLYCSFPSHSLQELGRLRSGFMEALLFEIEETGKLTRELELKPYSFYIGGGTPTALDPTDLERLLNALQTAFAGNLREFTVEAGRPDTLTRDHLEVMKRHDVGRVSVNPQTMHDKTLEVIGRCHSTADVAGAVEKVRSTGFSVLNMDMILGLPGEDEQMLSETVLRLLSFAPENITLHMFSRKKASRFDKEQGDFTLPGEKQATELYKAATALLEQRYIPYYLYRQREILGGQENIGYCLPGTECVYNIAMIEERHHILGMGGGATSKLIKPDFTLTNLTTPKDVHMYIERIRQLITTRETHLRSTLQ